MGSKDIRAKLGATEGELREAEAQAAKAKPDKLEAIGALVAGLQAKVKALQSQLRETEGKEAEAEAERERKRAERERAAAVKDFQKRRQAHVDAWKRWASRMEGLEVELLTLWGEYGDMLAERKDLAAEAKTLGLQLGDVTQGVGSELFDRMTRGSTPLVNWSSRRRFGV